MKLESKLGLSATGILGVLFLSSVAAHLRIAEANRLGNSVIHSQAPLLDATKDLGSEVALSVRAVESDLLYAGENVPQENLARERAKHMASAERMLQTIRIGVSASALDPADAQRVIQLGSHVDQLARLEEDVAQANRTGTSAGHSQALQLLHGQLMGLDETLSHEIDSLAQSQRSRLDTEMMKLLHTNYQLLSLLWMSTLLVAIAAAATSVLFTRYVSHGIAQLADRAHAIMAGDLTGSSLDVGSGDQLGELAHAMHAMQASLAQIIGAVVQTARSLTGSVDSMKTASDLVHHRIDEQSQQTQQAATALQEMSASIAEVSRHAQSAADTARSAAQTAHEGGDIVKQMLQSMSSIATAVSETSSTVGLLGDDSKRISQIVTVIDEIARKTNLLALNAAIEAARAGDQGRGFAVVAGEVRRLAESTAEATSQISSMIRGIQERTHIAIASMASGTVTVSQGVATTNLAGEALERIIGMAERVDRMIAQIAIAATQQSVAANQSSASLHSIYSLSHDNLCEMATTAAGIESLRSTAVSLEQQVVRFHIDENAARQMKQTPQTRTSPAGRPLLST